MRLKLVYFAWVREKVGLDDEALDVPDAINTVSGLIDWLAGRSEGHAQALEDKAKLRFAVNQKMAKAQDSLSGAQEVAIFPPVTGG